MTSRAFVRGLALAAGSFVCIGSAAAADLPRKAPPKLAPVPYVQQGVDWSGFYVGGHIGAGFLYSQWADPMTPVKDSINKGGFLGGVQIGVNKQINMIVLGAEGDFSGTGLKGTRKDAAGNTFGDQVNWTSTITGKLGAAVDNFLIYSKGGVAFTEDKGTFINAAGAMATNNMTRAGWTVGAGVEYAFDRNWSARIEYDYLDFGTKTVNFTTPAIGTVMARDRLNIQEVKAGFDYRFNYGPFFGN
jgi:outer membrane immunogenic protein